MPCHITMKPRGICLLLLGCAFIAAVHAQTSGTVESTWTPKLFNTLACNTYNPKNKDWTGVASACRAVGKYEKRFFNFWIRGIFHDAGSVPTGLCKDGKGICGPNGSLLLTLTELTRVENHEFAIPVQNGVGVMVTPWSTQAAAPLLKIAKFYDVSAADVLAVCSAVAIEESSGGRVHILGGPNGASFNFPVGRCDSDVPDPAGILPGPSFTTKQFYDYWTGLGFSAMEGSALLGSHSLLDEQGCMMGKDQKCDPKVDNTCSDKVRMFQWDNHYFKEQLAPTLTVGQPAPPAFPIFDPSKIPEWNDMESCRWSSPEFRKVALDALKVWTDKQITPTSFNLLIGRPIDWSVKGCTNALYCPHPDTWPYTTNDALMARVAQNDYSLELPKNASPQQIADLAKPLTAVRDAINLFAKNQAAWDSTLSVAYTKLTTKFAKFSPLAGKGAGGGYVSINGRECTVAYAGEPTCMSKAGKTAVDCSGCSAGKVNCDPCCMCPNAYNPALGYATRLM